jgi:hypothetical protein
MKYLTSSSTAVGAGMVLGTMECEAAMNTYDGTEVEFGPEGFGIVRPGHNSRIIGHEPFRWD